jgi:hypothetical protein
MIKTARRTQPWSMETKNAEPYRRLVVAMAAGEHLAAARRHDLAPPPVMLTPAQHKWQASYYP